MFKSIKANARKAGAVVVLATLSAPTWADGISDISTTLVTEINKVVPVISSVGVALLSVYVLVKAFRLVSGFVGGGR
ncbi:major capsid protein [Neisseria bergeri]|uniref:major capsid protein n=1 Tax=Neisseria bergeri TaxID=1906581 RepID=UPI00272C5ED4|nr:major capsid protein [Neisseria bergeri]